jgi:levansucrase
VLVHDRRDYLFVSTQARPFHPAAPAPPGLYGFVGPGLLGPYQPLNRTGLVMPNPPEEPFQAYSWLVLPDLRAVGFVDSYALHGRRPDDLERDDPAAARRHFGGTMAPPVPLFLDGTRAGPAPSAAG